MSNPINEQPEYVTRSRLGMVSRIGNWPFLGLIYAYRATLSPFIGGQCRFEPTCSRFGIDAYRHYGPIRGTKMTIGRIMRCHPFSKGGYDPVPIPEKSDPIDNPPERHAGSNSSQEASVQQ